MNIRNTVYLYSYILISLVVFSLLFFTPLISIYVLQAVFLVYLIMITMLLFRVYLYNRIFELSEHIGFRIITYLFEEPRIEGFYKNCKWQIHFRDKEAGHDPGILRTYIKLYLKETHNFQQKYDVKQVKNFRIIAVRYIQRKDKQYLLMKVSGFQFNYKHIRHCMDYLLEIYYKIKSEMKDK